MKIRKAKTSRLEPNVVIKAALEILDAEGLEHVTLRHLAEKLGVQAPALYWHFKDKRDITDDMAQAILTNAKLDRIDPPADINSWDVWLADLMRHLRSALMAHRDGGRVVAGATFGRAYALETILVLSTKVLEKAGFDRLHASMATAIVTDYVWGFVIEEQASMGRPEALISPNSKDDVYLIALMDEYHKTTPTKFFDWGLQSIITGLKSTLNKEQHSKVASP